MPEVFIPEGVGQCQEVLACGSTVVLALPGHGGMVMLGQETKVRLNAALILFTRSG
jgi:hypothetical protein